jgi:hypothetical protein
MHLSPFFLTCHCEERSDAAISSTFKIALDDE